MLAFGLLALTTTISLIHSARVLSIGIVIGGTLVFSIVQVMVYGPTPRVFLPSLVCLIALTGTAVLGTLANRHFTRVARQLEQQHQLVDELRIYDPDTNLLRYPYALQTLKTEIARSQRYNRQLCVFLLQVHEPPEWQRAEGADAKRKAQQQIAELLRGSLRTVDVPFVNATKFGAILPETDAVGARLVCERLEERIAQKMRLATHIGIAHFPSDGVTEEQLIRGAEAALHLAQTTEQPIVFYVQLRHAVQPSQAAPVELNLNPTTNGSPAPRAELQLSIVGLRDIADTLRIEKALRAYVGASNVHPARLVDGTLVLEVSQPPQQLAHKLPELLGLPIQQITQGDGWIQVRVKEASVA
jgi:GGDEF domain-containing protein